MRTAGQWRAVAAAVRGLMHVWYGNNCSERRGNLAALHAGPSAAATESERERAGDSDVMVMVMVMMMTMMTMTMMCIWLGGLVIISITLSA